MSLITLPPARRSTVLVGFWLAISLLAGPILSVLLSLVLTPFALGPTVVLTVLLCLPVLFWPGLAMFPYRVWNWLARTFALGARRFVTGVCFYVVLLAVAKATGKPLRLSRPAPGESLWVAIARPRWAGGIEAVAHDESFGRSWISSLLSWNLQADNRWTLCLLPFLILLQAVDSGEDVAPPEGIYTLF
jgi:hypothetical protein